MDMTGNEIANLEKMRDFALKGFRRYSDPENQRNWPGDPHHTMYSIAAAVNASAYGRAVSLLAQRKPK